MIIAVFAACNAGGRDIPPRHTEMYRRDIPLEACIQSRRISRRLSRRLRVVAERHVQPEYVVWILGHAVSFAHQEVDQCVSQHVGARAPDHLDRLPRGGQMVVLLFPRGDQMVVLLLLPTTSIACHVAIRRLCCCTHMLMMVAWLTARSPHWRKSLRAFA